jgi:hypothetical protein
MVGTPSPQEVKVLVEELIAPPTGLPQNSPGATTSPIPWPGRSSSVSAGPPGSHGRHRLWN